MYEQRRILPKETVRDRRSSEGRVEVGIIILLSNDDKEDDDKEDDGKEDDGKKDDDIKDDD